MSTSGPNAGQMSNFSQGRLDALGPRRNPGSADRRRAVTFIDEHGPDDTKAFVLLLEALGFRPYNRGPGHKTLWREKERARRVAERKAQQK